MTFAPKARDRTSSLCSRNFQISRSVLAPFNGSVLWLKWPANDGICLLCGRSDVSKLNEENGKGACVNRAVKSMGLARFFVLHCGMGKRCILLFYSAPWPKECVFSDVKKAKFILLCCQRCWHQEHVPCQCHAPTKLLLRDSRARYETTMFVASEIVVIQQDVFAQDVFTQFASNL